MNIFRLHTALFLGAATFSIAHVGRAQAQTPDATLLNPLFSDDAVLQRDRAIPIWGQAAPGATVTAKLDDQTRTAKADATGLWMVRVGPFSASATPHTLAVSSGTATETRRNILFGDVWLCSGQSNMEWGVGNLTNADAEIANANYPQIRLFTVPKKVAFTPLKTADSQWLVCNPANVKQGEWNGFSAVAYFFGRKLNQELGVPIGLIQSAWSGTVAEAWVSQSALGTMPDFRPQLAQVKEAADNGNQSLSARTEIWLAKNDPGYSPNWTLASADVSKWKTVAVPGDWDGSGVSELANFDGVAQFRREVEVPAAWAGHDLKLKLGGIDDSDTTFWNGKEVGNTDGWNTPREYTIPAAQVKAGRNVIAVRVTDNSGNGGFGSPADAMRLEMGADSLPLAGQWNYRLSTTIAQMATAPIVPNRGNPNVVSELYNGMIAPLEPFALKGTIWYQGEQNVERAAQYEKLLPTLINDWRRDFNTPLPFYIVQLAGFMAPDDAPRSDDWPQLRAAQMKVAQTVPNTGIAITTDIGDEKDIHPKDKQDVGLRLALAALSQTYGKKVESSGPTLQAVKPDGANLRLTFSHADGGLTLKGDANRVFAVAGADRNWFWATPRVEGNTVVLSSPVVANPVAARFGWSNLPRAALYNGAQLPAAPFSTIP